MIIKPLRKQNPLVWLLSLSVSLLLLVELQKIMVLCQAAPTP